MKFIAWADILLIGSVAVIGLSRMIFGAWRKKTNWTKEGLVLIAMAFLAMLRYWTVIQTVFRSAAH